MKKHQGSAVREPAMRACQRGMSAAEGWRGPECAAWRAAPADGPPRAHRRTHSRPRAAAARGRGRLLGLLLVLYLALHESGEGAPRGLHKLGEAVLLAQQRRQLAQALQPRLAGRD
jgi:hypothetical protein